MEEQNRGLWLNIEGAVKFAEDHKVSRTELEEALKSGALPSSYERSGNRNAREPAYTAQIWEADLNVWLKRR